MFNIEIIIFLLLLLYSLFYQVYIFILEIKNNKHSLNKTTSLTIIQNELKRSNVNIYTVKSSNNKRSYFDIRRNTIKLDDRDYDSNSLTSISRSFHMALDAIVINKTNSRVYSLLYKYLNKLFVLLFLVGIYFNAIDVMTVSLLGIIGILVFKFIEYVKKLNILNEDIDKIKKENKLSDIDTSKLYKMIVMYLYNDLSFNFFK